MSNIEIFQLAALRTMEAMWSENIRDTQPGYAGDIDPISAMYRKIGWGWYLDQYGVDGKYIEHNPENNVDMKWCGVGIGCAYLDAHKSMPYLGRLLFNPALAYSCLPSTLRMTESKRFAEASQRAGRLLPPFEEIEPGKMRRGDIVTTGNKAYGSHFRMCAEPPALVTKKWRSVEANGHGELPDGSRGEGIVRNTVALKEVKRVYRPVLAHMIPWPYGG